MLGLNIFFFWPTLILHVNFSRWHHQMETFSALLAICAGNSPVAGEFPTQCPVTQSFDVFFDLRPNERLSKQSTCWWYETLSRPLWRHSNLNNQCLWCRSENNPGRLDQSVLLSRLFASLSHHKPRAPYQYIDRHGISIINIRRSWDCLIYTMGIPMLTRWRLYI